MARAAAIGLLAMLLLGTGAIASSELDRLIQQTDPVEQTFQEGLTRYQQGNSQRALKTFRSLIRQFPGHARARDARYYVRLIESQVQNRKPAPLIRVKLRQSRSIRLNQSKSAELEFPDGSVRKLAAGESWPVTATESRLNLSEGSERNPEYVLLRPGSGEHLTFDSKRFRGTMELRARSGRVLLINRLPMNEYLYGVVRKEIAPGWPPAAVRSQAVASRSFALNNMLKREEEPYDLDATSSSQLYGGIEAESDTVVRAVDETSGEVLSYRDRPIAAYFHANSGGHTERPENVWSGTSLPYLNARQDPYSVGTNHDRWEAAVPMEQLTEAMRAVDLPAPDYPPNLRVSKRAPSGRALTVQYRSVAEGVVQLPGNRFRMAVGPETLRSTWFVDIQTRGTTIHFRGKGWGHGVGMSQWGAYAMAGEGYSYVDILDFYYPDAELTDEFIGEALHRANR